MTELVVFTHNDLDALGCVLNIEFKMPDVPKVYFYTNYSDIDDRVSDIAEHVEKNKNTHILIADVSFSDNKDALRELYSIAKVTHIDHHLYPDGFWDEFPEMTVVYDKAACATKLCNMHFGNAGKSITLDKLTKLIDVYDIWQVKDPDFPVAQDLNEYFWTWDLKTLADEIIKLGYKLPADYMKVVTGIKTTYTNAIADYENRKLIHRANGITFAFVNDWFNQILLKDMAAGQAIVVGFNNWGIVRVRINETAPYTDEQKNLLRLALTGTTDLGHMNAFTYKFADKVNFDGIMEEAKRVNTEISKMLQ